MQKTKPTNVEEYLQQLPEAAQAKMNALRAILKSVAPKAIETLKWGLPVFESVTILFAYSAHKSHMNFTPTGPAMKPFEKELAGFVCKKDSVQLPYDQPLPEQLIRKIAEYRKVDAEERGAKWKY